MVESARYRELRCGKRYNTHTERRMSENGSIEETVAGNSSENIEGEVSEIHTLTQDAANQHIKELIAPLTR